MRKRNSRSFLSRFSFLFWNSFYTAFQYFDWMDRIEKLGQAIYTYACNLCMCAQIHEEKNAFSYLCTRILGKKNCISALEGNISKVQRTESSYTCHSFVNYIFASRNIFLHYDVVTFNILFVAFKINTTFILKNFSKLSSRAQIPHTRAFLLQLWRLSWMKNSKESKAKKRKASGWKWERFFFQVKRKRKNALKARRLARL